MTRPFFAVDKDQSLEIMREIISLVGSDEDENRVMCNHNSCTVDGKYTLLWHRHKVAIVELELDIDRWFTQGANGPRKPVVQDPDISNYAHEFYKAVKQKEYYRSEDIEIYSGSVVNGDQIGLIAYLHETQCECDVSYPTFTYDEQYECWIVKEAFMGAKNGISGNHIVTILDFSEYVKSTKDVCHLYQSDN